MVAHSTPASPEPFSLDEFVVHLLEVASASKWRKFLCTLPVLSGLKKIEATRAKSATILAIVRSMTPEERQSPKMLSYSRIVRIATGSGTSVKEVVELLEQFQAGRRSFRTQFLRRQ